MKISVICENSVNVPMPKGIIGEHGLSFLIEGENTTLFDTGQGVGVIQNLAGLGKDINAIDRIILSHGHYDHVGGLLDIAKERKNQVDVYLHPDAFENKIAYVELPTTNLELPIGFSTGKDEYMKEGCEFKFIQGLSKIDDEVSALSDVERPKDWKGWDERLKVKVGDEIKDDPFTDDLSLIVETDSGPVVLLGCAHAGIVEILNDLSSKTGYKEFHGVIGGTHLGSAPEDYQKKAIEALKDYKVQVIGTSHCTGFKAACLIAENFKKEYREASVGNYFEF